MWSLMQAAHAVESQLEEALAQVELSGAKLAALTQLVEADEPVPLVVLAQVLERPRNEVEAELRDLAASYIAEGRGFDVREVAGDEKKIWWERAAAAYPPYNEYQARTDREIPLFVATRRA